MGAATPHLGAPHHVPLSLIVDAHGSLQSEVHRGELGRMQRGAMECLARVLSVECIDSLDVSGSALAPRILDMLRQGGVTTLHALIILRLAAHAQQARLGSVPLRDLVLPELRRLCESTDPTGNIRLLLQELEGGILG